MKIHFKSKYEVKFVLHAGLAAFGTYFCMYAFRKPFTVATFEGLTYGGVDYKIWLVIVQVLGYAFSKCLGVKFISELKSKHRLVFLISLISLAEFALLLFALVPAPYNILFMFINGIPLGMIWGIVFSYLEGRRHTDILGVVLCSSFIVSSGMVKSVGLLTMNQFGVSPFWMPFITGGIFYLPLVACAYWLNKIPKPNKCDINDKVARTPMTKSDRKKVISAFWFPLAILVLFYTFLTAFRDFRDNFARELWDSIGFEGDASVYASSEVVIAVVVLALVAAVFFIKNNFKALIAYHYLLLLGVSLIGISTLLFQYGLVNPFLWMVITGFGLYSCYVPFNCLFFDRFIAAFRIKGNSGFLIYIADSFGYLGSVGVLLYKNFGQSSLSWLNFFVYGAYGITTVGILITIISYLDFKSRYDKIELNNKAIYGNEI